MISDRCSYNTGRISFRADSSIQYCVNIALVSKRANYQEKTYSLASIEKNVIIRQRYGNHNFSGIIQEIDQIKGRFFF